MAMFEDRAHAGRHLARFLDQYRGRDDLLVLGLPRGGIPVAFEVARHLGAPLDVFVVRKLGVPGHEELAMGAIATGGVRILNERVVQQLGIPDADIARVTTREANELVRREGLYRGDRQPAAIGGRIVILVDDGLATGSTMRAAAAAVAKQGAARIVVAVPVAASETCAGMRDEVDEMVCAYTPEPFFSVGQWYEDFSQTSDEEVRQLLDEAAEGARANPGAG